MLIRSAMRDRGHVAVVREQEQSLGRLVGRAVDLAQRVAIDEVRLLKIESRDELLSLGLRAAGMTIGAFCFALAWLALWSAVVVWLETSLSLTARLGVVGAAHVVLGGVLLAWSLRGARR